MSQWPGPLNLEKKKDIMQKIDGFIEESSTLYGYNDDILLWKLLKFMLQHGGLNP